MGESTVVSTGVAGATVSIVTLRMTALATAETLPAASLASTRQYQSPSAESVTPRLVKLVSWRS
ncbi:MAG: hypothetical protein QM765_40135 [Myxococcales bacterium]